MMPQFHVRQFFDDPLNHSGVWSAHLFNYVAMPNKAKNYPAFNELDLWYLTFDISRGYLTKEELVNIMKWKLMRGKTRPLLKKIEALSEDAVQMHTQNGIRFIKESTDDDHVRVALDAISKPLSGVGPATASAVLAKWDPSIPFMSDAGLIAVNGTTDYTVASYIRYYQGIKAKVEQLNADGQSQHKWTARQVESVLHIIYCHFDLKVVLG